ncbi:hypothetical protein [Myxococcus landrumensis]|uniref:Lipoprotein n=1 Tax=Myxococcus landrumensis TaxID=2813577 RepID=A0ABX7N5Q9_9BACT|nr:hypothetical protein [Myxococcus landrumus]QSQ14066.1 hypothetical protein JY572_38090 [Myxococcus landrumus]
MTTELVVALVGVAGFILGGQLMGWLMRDANRAACRHATESAERLRCAQRRIDAATKYAHELMKGDDEEYDYGEHLAFLLSQKEES